MFEKRYLRYFDWLSSIIMLMILSIGVAFIFSATYRLDAPYSLFFKKQVAGILSGLVIYIICCFLDYRMVCRWSFYIFLAL